MELRKMPPNLFSSAVTLPWGGTIGMIGSAILDVALVPNCVQVTWLSVGREQPT